MSDKRRIGQETSSDFMELKHLSVEINKGLELSNLSQSIAQNIASPPLATPRPASADSEQGGKE